MGPIDCLLAVLNTNPATLQVSDSLDQFVQTVLDRLRNSSELDEIVGDLISTDVKASLVVAQTVRVHAAAVTASCERTDNKANVTRRVQRQILRRHWDSRRRATKRSNRAAWRKRCGTTQVMRSQGAEMQQFLFGFRGWHPNQLIVFDACRCAAFHQRNTCSSVAACRAGAHKCGTLPAVARRWQCTGGTGALPGSPAPGLDISQGTALIACWRWLSCVFCCRGRDRCADACMSETLEQAAFWQGRALAAIGGSGQHSSADMQTPSQHCPVSLEDLVANRTPQLRVACTCVHSVCAFKTTRPSHFDSV